MVDFFQKFPLEQRVLFPHSDDPTLKELNYIKNHASILFKSIFQYKRDSLGWSINLEFEYEIKKYFQLISQDKKSEEFNFGFYNLKLNKLIVKNKDLSSSVLYLLGLTVELKSLYSSNRLGLELDIQKQDFIDLLQQVQNVLLICYGMSKFQGDIKNSAKNWALLIACLPAVIGLTAFITLQYMAPLLFAASISGVIGAGILIALAILSVSVFLLARHWLQNGFETKQDLINYKAKAISNLRKDNSEITDALLEWPSQEIAIVNYIKALTENVLQKTYGEETPRNKM